MSSTRARELVRAWLGTTDPEAIGAVYAGLRAAGPLVRTPWGAQVVPGYADVRRALVDPALVMLDSSWRDGRTPGWRDSPATAALCDSLLMQNPPEHPVNRRPVVAAFTARSVAALDGPIRARVAAAVDDFARTLRQDGAADLIGDLCRPLPAAVLCRLAGFPGRDAAWLAELAAVLSTGGEIRRPLDELRAADRAAGELLRYFGESADSREPAPGVGPFDTGQLFALVAAGLITSTHLLGNLCDRLLRTAPDDLAAATAPGHRAALIEETLRWDPPVKLATRRAARRTTVAGLEIPAGTVLHLMIGAAHRDPAHYPDPDVFAPGRDHRPGFPFGHGGHFCPGAALARAQAEVFLEHFAAHLPDLRPSGPLRRRTGPSFTEPVGLPVVRRLPAPRPAPSRGEVVRLSPHGGLR
ncbi:cytochrome P450 [Kitasatospora sp. NBC_00070]|uniref:cytochrome P450 n=1 Tax=Kitasatospora sp. NBC_00070 TaxID=2975962 RepID=UPI00324A4621